MKGRRMQATNPYPPRMKADDIVGCIGKGVRNALKTNRLFLGIDRIETENADIRPEYVTTVKVAESLISADHVVSLETLMKTLRRDAMGLVRLRNLRNQEAIDCILEPLRKIRFGKKDSQRLDILVRSSEEMSPPMLLAEAKLGVRNVNGIHEDVDRIVKLLSMYYEAKLMKEHDIYGAVVFHSLKEGEKTVRSNVRGSKLLENIRAHLEGLSSTYMWLKHKADFLHSFEVTEPISGYQEIHEDGTVENVFQKDQFVFVPGLILLGSANDVETVAF